MELEFKSKLVDTNQSLTLLNSVTTFIGQNGCGKSSILEAIFKNGVHFFRNPPPLFRLSNYAFLANLKLELGISKILFIPAVLDIFLYRRP